MDNRIIVSYFNDIPILNIMNVKGYCVNINGKMRTFLSAKDIAIGAGLDFVANSNYEHKKIIATSCNNSDINSEEKINATSCINSDNNIGIRWNTFNQYAYDAINNYSQYDNEITYIAQYPYNEYSFMPQEIAYLVLMRCKSAKAKQFQAILAKIVSDITNNTIMIMQNNYSGAINYLRNIIKDRNEIIKTQTRTIGEQNERIGSLEYFLDEKDKKIENEVNGVTLDDIDYVSSIYNINPDKLREILFDLKIKIDYQMTENDCF